jgi:UDP-N-acetylmuramyl pentapeptide phosphotransferase/UDP-N-acetylglucosamine-1-phosphate transferase
VGAAVGAAVAPGVPAKLRVAGAGTALAIGAAGLYDDISGSTASKGLHGHLSALRTGEVTSGVVKIAVLGASGLAGAATVSDNAFDAFVGGAAIAGHANLLNLFDLRPGRAAKVVLMHAPLAIRGRGGPIGAAAIGAAAAAMPDDLGERTMLGDAGANALGGVLGLALVANEGRRGRLLHLACVSALILASEKVSFTKVISNTPWLRYLDEVGRMPPP